MLDWRDAMCYRSLSGQVPHNERRTLQGVQSGCKLDVFGQGEFDSLTAHKMVDKVTVWRQRTRAILVQEEDRARHLSEDR